jgi:hypothetical protein
MVERIAGTAVLALCREREYVRNHILQALLEWDHESARLEAEVRAKLLARTRKPVEGSREWDLLFTEEIERVYGALAARGG